MKRVVIEVQIENTRNPYNKELWLLEFIRMFRDSVLDFVKIRKEQFFNRGRLDVMVMNTEDLKEFFNRMEKKYGISLHNELNEFTLQLPKENKEA